MIALDVVAATDRAAIQDIVARRRPAVFRQLASDWPIVRAARAGGNRWIQLLRANAANSPVPVILARREARGRFHYESDALAMNFDRQQIPLAAFLAALERDSAQPDIRPVAAQGIPAERFVPGFSVRHPMPHVPPGTEARLWIGTASEVATHNDPTDNIAVVGAGRRRFTLFPPEAEADLYMGPAEPSPAGTPISMVHVTAPDLDRYPRYADAMAVALQSELEPGDAIFIPANWFHHVEALDRLNLLVNYWWPPAVDR